MRAIIEGALLILIWCVAADALYKMGMAAGLYLRPTDVLIWAVLGVFVWGVWKLDARMDESEDTHWHRGHRS